MHNELLLVGSVPLDTVQEVLADFGLGAYCGFGRVPPAELPTILDDHLKAVEMAGATN